MSAIALEQRDPLEEEIDTLIGLHNYGIPINVALSMPAARYDIVVERIIESIEKQKRSQEEEKVKMKYAYGNTGR
jgi:hypothetical protein